MSSQRAAKEPRIGVGVFILNAQNQFIVGKRKGSHGAGTYALPGGHLEFGETFEACAARETLEETGLKLIEGDLKFLTATNNVFTSIGRDGEAQLHYVTVFMVGRCELGAEPQLLEADKCEGWEWVDWRAVEGWGREQKEVEGEGKTPTRELFLPLLDLFAHRPGVHPSQALED